LLYWLLYQILYPHFSPFRIFRYLTFRTAFASLTALFMGLIVGPAVIRQLREFQIGQYIREEGPKAHAKKAGTPTMGGVLIVIAIVIPTILWADLTNKFTWLAVLSTLAFAAIGFADDYIKVVHRRNLGLTARTKLVLQFATSFAVASSWWCCRRTASTPPIWSFPSLRIFIPIWWSPPGSANFIGRLPSCRLLHSWELSWPFPAMRSI
jgi:phospho-N-acetylmuramoyl-pentapeptide-transferase